MALHRGGKDGPILGTANARRERDDTINVHFTDSMSVLRLQHHHYKLPSLQSESKFTHNERTYRWKGHNELVDDQSKEVIATFKATWFEDKSHVIGRIDVNELKELELEVIVFTALVVQQREEEHRISVCLIASLLI